MCFSFAGPEWHHVRLFRCACRLIFVNGELFAFVFVLRFCSILQTVALVSFSGRGTLRLLRVGDVVGVGAASIGTYVIVVAFGSSSEKRKE